MPSAQFTSHWTPVPDQAAVALQQAGQYAALIVWQSMLRDAARNQAWQTSVTIRALACETGFTKPTIIKAQRYLTEHGYATAVSGGGQTRKTVTFALTPIASFNIRPVRDRKEPEARERGDWES